MEPVQGKTRNVICVSDSHSGCKLAICPRSGFQVDEGAVYQPSQLQLKLCDWWDEFWGEWVPLVTRGEPWDLVHNGDTIDGDHHGSNSQITHNLIDQERLAIEQLRPVVEKCHASGGRYFQIRGTGAHVGASGEHEESIARQLEAAPNEFGNYARWELWLRVGDGLVHFMHHIGTTGSSHHEASAVNAELTAEFAEAARWYNEPPQIIVRSHRHRHIEVRLPTARGFATACVTPAWQLKTPFTYRIAGMRLAPPQIGGILIRHGDRALYTDPWVQTLERSKEE